MSTKNKLDKVAYVMLNIAAIIVLILAVGVIGLGIYGCYVILIDSTLRGLVLLFMAIISVIACPLLAGWLLHLVLHLLGLIPYCKSKMVPARIFGLISSFVAITNSLVTMVMGIMIYGGEEGSVEVLTVMTIVPGICILYMAIPFVLLIVSMCKKKVVV